MEEGGTVCKEILGDAKLKTGKRGQKKRAELEKSIKEAKVRLGLWCHLRRRRRYSNFVTTTNQCTFIL